MEIKSPRYAPGKAHRDKKKIVGRFNQDIKHKFNIQEWGSCGRKASVMPVKLHKELFE